MQLIYRSRGQDLQIGIILFYCLIQTLEYNPVQTLQVLQLLLNGFVKVSAIPASWNFKTGWLCFFWITSESTGCFRNNFALQSSCFLTWHSNRLCSAFISWLHFSYLELILHWVQKMHRSGMKLICLTLSLDLYKYVGFSINLLAFTEHCLLERNLKACE